jgi:hypothetical protein
MNKFLITVFAATAFMSPTLANAQMTPATGNSYPPCTSTRTDECTQVGKVVHKAKSTGHKAAHKAKTGKHQQMNQNSKKPSTKAKPAS